LVTVRAEPGVDEIRVLRAWLKIGLRSFGLKCVGITSKEKEIAMDLKKYGTSVIRPEELADGPRVEKIVNIYEHDKHNCVVLEFESGDQLYLWSTRVLGKAWGWEREGWLEQEVELSLGHYLDKKTDPPTEKECINVRAVSPAKLRAGNGSAAGTAIAPAATSRGKMDDEIPF
jgi:hypothetical protein